MEANENSGERKIKRFKVRERERGGSLPRPSSFFPRSPAARRTDPLTEGLEQANCAQIDPLLCYSPGGGGYSGI